MKKIKVCSFVASYTHSCIVVNNFVSKEFSDAKVIYINELEEKEKLKNIINQFFKRVNSKIFYTEWLNEEITNDYANENIVLVVYGSEKFIDKVNRYLCFIQNEVFVINCYDILEMKSKTSDITARHDYYLNTSGIELRNN